MNVIFLISSIRNGLRPTISDELQSNVIVLKLEMEGKFVKA